MNNKVVFIVNNFPPTICGVGDYTYFLSKELVRKNMQVFVICNNKNSNTILNEQGLSVYPIIDRLDFRKIMEIFKIVKSILPTITIIQYTPVCFNKRGIALNILFLLLKVRTVSKVGIFFHEVRAKAQYTLKSFLKSIIAVTQIKFLTLFSNFVLSSNKHYCNLISLPFSKAYLIRIPPNLDIEKYKLDVNSKTSYRLNIGIHDSDIVFGTFGRYPRGYKMLIEACKYLNSLGLPNKFKILFIGKYSKEILSDIERLRIMVDLGQDYVLKTGYVSEQEAVKYLCCLDVYTMLEFRNDMSGWLGTSTRSGTLAAAFGLGLPTIGVKGELNDEFLAENENIVFLESESESVQCLGETILQLSINKNFLEKISYSARLSFEKELSWNNIATAYEKLIENKYN